MDKLVSLVIPFRDRPAEPFRLSLESLKTQTDSNYEVIVIDMDSHQPYQKDMEKLCREYGVKYHKPELPYPDEAIEVNLWNLLINWGFRKADGDLLVYGGMDRIYESNIIENIRKAYNYYSRDGQEVALAAHVWDIYRTPDIPEIKDFNKLFSEAKWRGGYGYLGSSTKWLHKVRGLDELSRWRDDLDLVKRIKLDGGKIIWTSHGRALKTIPIKPSRMIHMAKHLKIRAKYPIKKIVKVVKRSSNIYHACRDVIRNTPDWGMITYDHIRWLLDHN